MKHVEVVITVTAVAVATIAAVRAWRRAQKEAESNSQRVQELEECISRQGKALKKYEATLAELQQKNGTSSPARPVLYRVVLTGGPCGGKTTALAELKRRLESLGFLILCLPEMATLFFSGGVPFPHDDDTALTFQRNLLQAQLTTEDAFIDLATQSGRPAVILLDRGTMDGKAYMSEEQWELMLEELKVTPVALRDQRYDAILHLVTAAEGAESFYTLANNQVRELGRDAAWHAGMAIRGVPARSQAEPPPQAAPSAPPPMMVEPHPVTAGAHGDAGASARDGPAHPRLLDGARAPVHRGQLDEL